MDIFYVKGGEYLILKARFFPWKQNYEGRIFTRRNGEFLAGKPVVAFCKLGRILGVGFLTNNL